MHNFSTLTQHKNGYIGLCKCCQKYNLAFKNSLFILNEFEIEGFIQLFENKIGFSDFETSHGKQYMMHTPMLNYYILFTEQEIEEVKNMIKDASVFIKVYKEINSNLN